MQGWCLSQQMRNILWEVWTSVFGQNKQTRCILKISVWVYLAPSLVTGGDSECGLIPQVTKLCGDKNELLLF